jgi:L-amino acid N-acyltransferase YncA
MARTRSEYRLLGIDVASLPVTPTSVRHVVLGDREAFAALLLDAYRGTVDDEGETEAEALEAVDAWFGHIVWTHSFVIEAEPVPGGRAGALQAGSFVVMVDGRAYIDPVVTRAGVKRTGIGTSIVSASLASLASVGVDEVGATITDGNVASERLFAKLGFRRIGSW